MIMFFLLPSLYFLLSSRLPFMLSLTRARLPPLPSFSTYVLKLTRRLLRPLTTRAFPHTTSRHPLPLLRTSSDALRHPSLYCACLSENPFLTHLHSHFPLNSTAAANGATRVVASASLLIVFSTTNLDGRTTLHLYTISLYPLIYQSPRGHTQLRYSRPFHFMLRHRSHDFGWGIQPQITRSPHRPQIHDRQRNNFERIRTKQYAITLVPSNIDSFSTPPPLVDATSLVNPLLICIKHHRAASDGWRDGANSDTVADYKSCVGSKRVCKRSEDCSCRMSSAPFAIRFGAGRLYQTGPQTPAI